MRRCADSIELANLEPIADQFDLLAGYDDGAWPDAAAIAQQYPGKTVIRITTNPADDEGDMLDVENGDARPEDAPGWIARRRAAGHGGPLVYCSETIRAAVVSAFQAAAAALPGLFVAAIPGDGAVLQDPTTDVGHQWAYHGTYDESVVVDYLPGIDPAPTLEVDMDNLVLVTVTDGNKGIFLWNTASERFSHLQSSATVEAYLQAGVRNVNHTTVDFEAIGGTPLATAA